MYVDALGLVSDAQALAATGFSTNTIDNGNVTPKRQIGDGEPVGFGVTIDVALAGTGPTLTIDVVQSDNADLSVPDVLSNTPIPAADATAGAGFFAVVPKGKPTKRYIGLRYNLGGTTPTVTVTAQLTLERLFSMPKPQTYAKGYSIQ